MILGRPADDECLPYYFQYIRSGPRRPHRGYVSSARSPRPRRSSPPSRPEQARRREAPGEMEHARDRGARGGRRALIRLPRAAHRARRPGHVDRGRVRRLRGGGRLPGAAARRHSGRSSPRCAPRSSRSCAAWTRRPGSAARPRTGRSAACAPSPTRWPDTSSIMWPISGGSTAGHSRARRAEGEPSEYKKWLSTPTAGDPPWPWPRPSRRSGTSGDSPPAAPPSRTSRTGAGGPRTRSR